MQTRLHLTLISSNTLRSATVVVTTRTNTPRIKSVETLRENKICNYNKLITEKENTRKIAHNTCERFCQRLSSLDHNWVSRLQQFSPLQFHDLKYSLENHDISKLRKLLKFAPHHYYQTFITSAKVTQKRKSEAWLVSRHVKSILDTSSYRRV